MPLHDWSRLLRTGQPFPTLPLTVQQLALLDLETTNAHAASDACLK
jgi:hypothetical protein